MLHLHCPALLQVSTNDTAMTLLPLLERPPWVRRGKGGAPEKFVGGAWQAVEARERHRLTQQDGQVGAAAVQLAVGYRLAGDLLCLLGTCCACWGPAVPGHGSSCRLPGSTRLK
jgi:hypothetical protein